jgi:flagellar basal body-associated protein FliL
VAEEKEVEKTTAAPGFKWLGTAVAAAVLAALGGWFWTTRSNTPAQASEGPHVKSTLHLETFVMNLADADTRSYLRVGIDLGLNQAAPTTPEGPPVAQVRDTILGVLALAKVEDLLTAKGKAKLKEDLLHGLQEHVPELGVEEIYFTEFLIQR